VWRGGVSGTGVVVLLLLVVVGGCVVRWVELLLAAGQRCCGPNGGGGRGHRRSHRRFVFLSYRLRQHGVMRLMHCLIGSQPVGQRCTDRGRLAETDCMSVPLL